MKTKRDISYDLKKKYTRIAYYYYKAGMTQQEIACRMGMSRQQINRILEACIDLGIVKISIDMIDEFVEMETELERRYGLNTVRLTNAEAFGNVNEALGSAAGEYLRGAIKSGDIIGVVPGRAISSLADNIGPISKDNLTFTQLIGSETMLEPKNEVNGIIHRFSMRLSAVPIPLYAPVIVSNEAIRASIKKEPYFTAAYETMKSCTVALVGIGRASGQRTYFNDESFRQQIPPEAVGEVCTYYYDAQGKHVDVPFSDRVIAVDLDDYLNIPTRIGVAGGKEKADAIRGAVIGKYINVLVTDLEAAAELLK